ncbi:MAG: 4-phosphoerythronate dehydrogenase [Bacteroidales bacterium]|nr:4-phosphoerythronate dehydrogenase [Bacteroidales bacterium]
MKIVVDKDIPFIGGVLEEFAQVVYLPGKEIVPEVVKDADALVMRTRTKCYASLLEGSSVKFIATATIGTDHIDLEYCAAAGIAVKNAAGCNSGGVMQYVFTSLFALARKNDIILTGKSVPDFKIGIIGVGNVGAKVAAFGEYLGFEVLRCDPNKEREQTLAFNRGEIPLKDFKDFYSLEYVLEQSDIITLHTDLNPSSRGLAGEEFFAKMKEGSIFINSSRGEVVCDAALKRYREKLSGIILDVWNGEPDIDLELLEMADIATPHIAGYSYEGKVNGTTMAVKALAEYFNIEPLKNFRITPPDSNKNFFNKENLTQNQISEYFENIFPIFEHCADLKQNPQDFEKLRSNFKYRREFYVI